MTVRELIRILEEHDQDAEVHFMRESFLSDTTEAHEVYASTTTYGLLCPEPTIVSIVVLASGSEGL